jgi:hypothetical protein
MIVLKYPGWSALFLAAMTVSGVPIWYAYRCGLLLATEQASAWQFGLACAVLATCSVAIPSLAVGACKRGRVGSALLGGLASICLLGFSIYGTATVELMQRAAQSSERGDEEQRLRDLRAELKAAQDRIAGLGVHRSAAQIDAEMKAEQQSVRWAATEGCTRATTAESRAYCATQARLFGELAGAGEADRHLAGIERIRQQIKDVLASRRPSMADFEVALIARILKADKDAVELIRAVGRAIAIDLVGVAFLTLVWANHPETQASGCIPIVRATRWWWWQRRNQREHARVDHATSGERAPANAMPSSPIGAPNASVNRPGKRATLSPKKGATLIPVGQVLTFPRAIIPNASNNATPGVGDSRGEDHQPPQPVLGAAALAILPAPIPKPVHRPSPLVGDNSREHDVETIGGILPAFDRDHLERVEGASASASDICAALQTWCAKNGVKVPSQKRLGLYLAGLGFKRWKRNGKMHYQHVHLKGATRRSSQGWPERQDDSAKSISAASAYEDEFSRVTV